jgi:hypothetical protein
MAATKNSLAMARPPESTFADGAVSVFLSASSHDTSPYNPRGSIFIVPPGRAIRYDEVSVHASAALRMVPSPPRTMKISSFSPAASAKNRSISFPSPHHVLGLTMPARLRILSILGSDSKSQPPLEALIIAPVFSSDKRMSLGTNHDCVDEGLVRRLNAFGLRCAHSTVRSALTARIVSLLLCFFSNPLELFLKPSEIFISKTF